MVATGTAAPTYEDLERLPYLKQVIKEVLRLYPAIPMFPREATTDDILPTGHRVDAGTVSMNCCVYLRHLLRLCEGLAVDCCACVSCMRCIYAGDVVFMSTYTLGRSERIWGNPLEFDPERFSPENEKKQHKCALP